MTGHKAKKTLGEWAIEVGVALLLLGLATWGALLVMNRLSSPTARLSEEDAREYAYLESALRDLAGAPLESTPVLQFECADWQRKADRFVRLDVRGIREMVRKYAEGCAALRERTLR